MLHTYVHVVAHTQVNDLYAATSDKTVVSISGKPLYVHYYNTVTVNFMHSLPISVLSTKLAQL